MSDICFVPRMQREGWHLSHKPTSARTHARTRTHSELSFTLMLTHYTRGRIPIHSNGSSRLAQQLLFREVPVSALPPVILTKPFVEFPKFFQPAAGTIPSYRTSRCHVSEIVTGFSWFLSDPPNMLVCYLETDYWHLCSVSFTVSWCVSCATEEALVSVTSYGPLPLTFTSAQFLVHIHPFDAV